MVPGDVLWRVQISVAFAPSPDDMVLTAFHFDPVRKHMREKSRDYRFPDVTVNPEFLVQVLLDYAPLDHVVRQLRLSARPSSVSYLPVACLLTRIPEQRAEEALAGGSADLRTTSTHLPDEWSGQPRACACS
jgi:hypothetical protein